MSNISDIYNSKIDIKKIVGNDKYFNNTEELSEFNKLQQKYISNVDYSNPANFARFGSAKEYYNNCISYISSDYPHDASTSEKLEWTNSLNEFEYHVFLNEYPRSKGHCALSSSQYINVYSHVKQPKDETRKAFLEGKKYTDNTVIDFKNGLTFESWLKFESSTSDTSILTVNAVSSSAGSATPINLFYIKKTGGSNPIISITDGTSNYNFSYNLSFDEWHHYAFHINESEINLFVDGQLTEKIQNISLSNVTGSYVFNNLGLIASEVYYNDSLMSNITKSNVFMVGGGAKLYLDETRLWNGKRQIEKIGRYWFTNIDGNDFSDIENSNLLFYFKFNEGWDDIYQFLCLDYSGRENDSEINNFNINCKLSTSAIDESGLVQDVEKGDIIYKGLEYSTTVKEFYQNKLIIGQEYDLSNNHMLYNKFPFWILEEEETFETKHLKQIIQIVSSYFDDLYNKVKEITEYKTIRLNEDKQNIYPFYDKILTSSGFNITDLFSNLDIIEKISSRNDTTLFDDDIQKIKNQIFQNIYSNLSYILKSKGTEKSIKNFLKSYGINDQLVRVNLYADGGAFNYAERSKQIAVKKKNLILKNDNTVYLSGSSFSEDDLNYFSFENCLSFPSYLADSLPETGSLFGLEINNLQNSLSNTQTYDFYNAYIENDPNLGSRFVFIDNFGNISETEYYKDLYDDSAWNIVFRKKPTVDTINGANLPLQFILEIYGVNNNTSNHKEFSLTLPYASSGRFIRYFIGAHKLDYTGATIFPTNCKFLYCNFWDNYLDNNTIVNHNKDITSYGANE